MKINQVLYAATAAAIGGREGRAVSSDGALDVELSMPRAIGGRGGPGTNPEQLFAAGFSSCFLGALRLVASRKQLTLPYSTTVSTRVAIGPTDQGFAMSAELTVESPDVDPATLATLVEEAKDACPYSNATRSGMDVRLKVPG